MSGFIEAAVIGAVIGGGTAAVTGGDVKKGVTRGAIAGPVGGAIAGFANVMASTRPLQPPDLAKNLTVRQILELKTSLLAGEEEEEQLGVAVSTN